MKKKQAIGILDLGASGGRVFALTLDEQELQQTEVHRFAHEPQHYWQGLAHPERTVQRTCWDLGAIYAGMLEGLARIGGRDDLELVSFGIDTWGSDGAWITRSGDILGMIGTGRDARWALARDETSDRISERDLYHLAATSSEPFCVVNQLYWYARHMPQIADLAAHYMPINSLLHYYLCGARAAEYTWMSTTLLCRPGSDDYNQDVFERLELPLDKMPPLVQPGTHLGSCHSELANGLGLPEFAVTIPATHDTASAYVAAPVLPDRHAILISSGTWTLIGIPQDQPLVSDVAFDAGLTNIGGCEGVYFHEVLMGNWPAQQLRDAWSRRDGNDLSWEAFGQLAQSAPALAHVVDINDPVFLAPQDMELAVRAFCSKTQQEIPGSRAEMARAVYEGLALRIAVACEDMIRISSYPADEIIIVGGGSRNESVNQWVADATGLPVRTGSSDATALGNGLVQGRAIGWFDTLEEGRGLSQVPAGEYIYEPRQGGNWDQGKEMIRTWQASSRSQTATS